MNTHTLFRSSHSLALFAFALGTVAVSGCGFADGTDIDDLLGSGGYPGPGPDPAPNPCATVDCFPNHTCVVTETHPPQAKCVPIENPCATVDCLPNFTCVASETYPPQAKCVPVKPPVTCFSTSQCGAGERCSVDRGDCQLPPSCDKGGPCTATAVCGGVCEPSPPPQGSCRVDSDCHLEANYCGGCQCDAIGNQQGRAAAQAPIVCSQRVACLVDPCKDSVAACVSGTCRVVGPPTPPTPGAGGAPTR